MGVDATPLGDVTLDMWARAVATAALQLPAPRVLVAHSRGGIVISQAAEVAGDAIAGLVYVAALLVPDGINGYEASSWSGADPIPAVVAADGASFALERAVARDRLYSGTPADLAEAALDRLQPEPLAPLSTPLKLTAARYGRAPRSYIACSGDRSTIDETLRAEMLRRSPCEMVRVIDADHSPFYSAPVELTEAILAAPFAR